MNRGRPPVKPGSPAKQGRAKPKKKEQPVKKLKKEDLPNSDVKLGGMGRCQFKPCKCPTFQADTTLTHSFYETSSLCSRCEHAKMYHRLTPKDVQEKKTREAEVQFKQVEAKAVVPLNKFPGSVDDCDCEKFRLLPPAMQVLISSPPQTSQATDRRSEPQPAVSDARVAETATLTVGSHSDIKLAQPGTVSVVVSANAGSANSAPPSSADGAGQASAVLTLQALLALPPSERPPLILCKCRHGEVYHFKGAKADDRRRKWKMPKKKAVDDGEDALL